MSHDTFPQMRQLKEGRWVGRGVLSLGRGARGEHERTLTYSAVGLAVKDLGGGERRADEDECGLHVCKLLMDRGGQ